MTIRLAQPQSDEDWRQARQLIEECAASLDLDLSFQNFAHELEYFTSEYAAPTGAFLLAEEKGVYVGCVGVRQFSDGIGEIKRLYVIPAARGRGIGRLLAEGSGGGQAAAIHPLASGYTTVHEGGSVLVRVPGVQFDCGVSIQSCPRDCFPGIGASMNTKPYLRHAGDADQHRSALLASCRRP